MRSSWCFFPVYLLLFPACATTNFGGYAEDASGDVSIATLNEDLKGYRITFLLRDGHRYETFAPEIRADSIFFEVTGPFYEVSGPARDRAKAIALSEVEHIVRSPNTNKPLVGGAVGVALGTLLFLRMRQAAKECDADNCIGPAVGLFFAKLGIPISGLLGIMVGAGMEGPSKVYRVVPEGDGSVRVIPLSSSTARKAAASRR